MSDKIESGVGWRLLVTDVDRWKHGDECNNEAPDTEGWEPVARELFGSKVDSTLLGRRRIEDRWIALSERLHER